MSKKIKAVVLLIGIAALVVVIIIFQAFLRKPDAMFKLANIPAGEYDPVAWGKHYPLEYESYQKNREMSPSPTGFGGSEKVQKSIKEPEIIINFKGMLLAKTIRRIVGIRMPFRI